MGKGDRKTKKGKRAMGSYGVSRKRKRSTPFVSSKPKKKVVKAKTEVPAEAKTEKKTTTKTEPAKKTAAKKTVAKKPAAKKPAAKKTAKKTAAPKAKE